MNAGANAGASSRSTLSVVTSSSNENLEYLKKFASGCGCSLKKLKVQLIGMNHRIREGRGKMEGERGYGKGLRGLKIKEIEEIVDETAE